MQEVNFLQSLHNSSKRNYLERITAEKPDNCKKAKEFSYDYWDGDRKFGYGGMKYDGRWKPIAEKISQHFRLNPGDHILDIGCGKGYLLYDISRTIPDLKTFGTDISRYAADNAKEEVKPILVNSCTKLPFKDKIFDFTYSINTFHNLGIAELKMAIQEMNRVTKSGGEKYICIESYRNEEEKCNLLNWQLTCQSFYSPDDWKFILQEFGYNGEIEFIYFV